ncbi:MAG: RHS repeat-associated core domain-containing protein [Thermoguttaceae bacterium]
MSVVPLPVPLPNPFVYNNPVEQPFEQALGSPTPASRLPNGFRGLHVGLALGTGVPVLSSYANCFAVSASMAFPAPVGAISVNPTGPTTATHTDTWTENGNNYSALESDTSELSVNAAFNNGQWTYTETVTSSFTISTTDLTNSSGSTQSSGDYNYTFSAWVVPNSYSTFSYYCTLADATARGTAAGPMSMANGRPMSDCWQETASCTGNINNDISLSSGSATYGQGGWGSMSASYWTGGWSGSGSYIASQPYTDPSNSTLTGSGWESGYRGTSYDYCAGYSSGSGSGSGYGSSSGIGWGYTSQSRSDAYGYAASGSSGARNESGGYSGGSYYSASFTPYSSWGCPYWWESSGYGNSYDSGSYASSYPESGGYSNPSSDGSISGTYSGTGYDNTSYNHNAGWSCSGGMWQATSGSGTQRASGGDNLSYSGSGSYADSGSGYTDSGALGENGTENDTYNDTTNLTLSSMGTWSSGSTCGTATGSGYDDTSYSGGGGFTDASDNISGTFTENGWDDESYTLSDSGSGGAGSWTPTSGSGSDTDSAGDHYTYTGSGSLIGSGAGSGFTVTSGTQSESGGDTDSYSDTAGYAMSSDGMWDESSGSGGASDSGYDDWSYSESGNYAAGDASLSGTFSENGSDDGSYGDNVGLGYSGGAWSASSGSGSVSDSGGNNDSYNLCGSFADSSGGVSASGTDSVSGSDNVTYGDTASYSLGSGGAWNEGSDSGWASGGGSFNPSASGGGSYSGSWTDLTPPISADRPPGGCSAPSFQVPNGTPTSGTFQAGGGDGVTYGFNVSDSGYGGSDSPSGTLTETDVGSAYDSYGGSGSYCASGGSGTVGQSGNDNESYSLTSTYRLAADGSWRASGGCGTDTGSGTATAGYSGGGSCCLSPIYGTFDSGDSDTSTYGYSLGESCDRSGNWTATSGTGTGTDTGGNYYGYYGNGTYWGPPASGTLTQDQSGTFNYNDSAGYTLAGGSWLANSGSGNTSGSDYAYSSYSGSGVPYSRSDLSTYALSGTVWPNGYQSGSDNYQTTLGVNAQGNWINTTGSGSAHQESGNGCTYGGSGSLSSSSGSGSNYSWFTSMAGEHGSQYDSQGQTQAWTLGSGQWSASGAPQDWTIASGESAYNFSASGGSVATDAGGTLTKSFNEQVGSDTFTPASGGSSGSGAATYGGSACYSGPSSGWATTTQASDNWSQPTTAGQNNVWGAYGQSTYNYDQSAPGFGGNDYTQAGGQNEGGIGTPPTNADGQYGPGCWAHPNCEISPAAGAGIRDWGLGIGGGQAAGSPLLPGEGQGEGLSLFANLQSLIPWSSNPQSLIPSATASRDAAGNLTSLTDANGGVTRFSYDPAGNLASLTDPVGNTTSFLYDGQGRLTQETDGLGNSRSFAYDSSGNLAQYTDRNGQVRQFQYDPSGNVTAETWYAGGLSQVSSDETGTVPLTATPENTIQYTRNSAGRITSESDNSTADTYTYDSVGQITSTTESSVGGPTVTLACQYNPAGERTEMAATIDGTADFVDDYTYNSLGQVTAVHQHGVTGGDAVADVQVDFAYNTAGEVATVDRYQDGQLAVEGDYSYDSLGRLVGLVYHQGTTTLSSYAWTYSGDSPVASASPLAPWSPTGGLMPVHDTSGVTEALMSGGLAGADLLASCTSIDGTASYAYDPTGQLVGATYTGGQASETYSYDANGNRTTANGSTCVTGPDNELLSDGTYAYAYDAEGNRTAKFIDSNHDGVLGVGDTNVTVYAWDNRNRLASVTTYATFGGAPTQIVDYLYDAENRWIGETISVPGQAPHQVRFVYDGNQIVLEFDKDGSGVATGADLSHRYLWQPNAVDQILADEQLSPLPPGEGQGEGVPISQPGTVVFPLTDNLGTVRDLAQYDPTTQSTLVVAHRVYSAFGQLVSQTNPSNPQAAAVDCLFGFTGRPFDTATGLQNNLNRWYDPGTGEWLSQDPSGFAAGDTNLYRYVRNSPTNASDPSGLISYWGAFWDNVKLDFGNYFGLSAAASAGMVAAGQRVKAIKPVGMLGSPKGSSVASWGARKVLPKASARLAGRAVPWVGLAGLVTDAICLPIIAYYDAKMAAASQPLPPLPPIAVPPP